MDKKLSHKDILLAVLCNGLWGTPAAFMKTGYAALGLNGSDFASIWVFGGLRIFFAGLALLVISAIRNHGKVLPSKGLRLPITAVALLQTTAVYALYFVGVANTTGTNVTIITGLNVFVASVLSSFLFKEDNLTTKKIIGFVLGFGGLVLCFLRPEGFAFSIQGDLLVFLHVFLFSLGSNLVKFINRKENVLVVASWNYMIGGGILLIMGLCFGGRITNWNLTGISVLLFTIMVSIVSFYLWNTLLLRNNISQIAVFQLCNPIVSFLLSVLMLGENSFKFRYIGALGLIIIGIITVTVHRKRQISVS